MFIRTILVTFTFFLAPLVLAATPRECLRALGGGGELSILKAPASTAKVDEKSHWVIESANKQFALEVKGDQVVRRRRESKDRSGAIWGDDTWGHSVIGLGFIEEPTDHARAWWLLDDGRFFRWDSRDDSKVEKKQLLLGALSRTPVVSADYSEPLERLVILHEDGVGYIWDMTSIEQSPFFIPESKKPLEIKINVSQKTARIRTEGEPLEVDLQTGEVSEAKAQATQIEPKVTQETSTPPASSSVLEDIVKNPDGSVRKMNHAQAEAYCQEHDLRLPTARELAQEAMRFGAQGIRETAHVDEAASAQAVKDEIVRMKRDGYTPIYKQTPSGGTGIDFYFSYSGYRRPEGDLGNNWFWSSSVHPDHSYNAYYLDGYYGGIYYGNRSYYYYGALRGVRVRPRGP